MSKGGSGELEVELAAWRGRVLTAFLWMAVAVALIGGSATLIDLRSPLVGVASITAGTLALWAALRPSLGYATRARVFVVGIFAANTALLVLGDYGPNTLGLMMLLALQATLLLGRRWGIAAVVLGAVAFVVVTLLHRSGTVPPLIAMAPAKVARTTFDFVLLATVGVVSVAYLLDRAEGLLHQRAAAIRALEEEQRERQRVSDELRLRDAALRKARELEILGRLAGSITHDFNNALLIIQANVELAALDKDVTRAFSEIASAVKQASATTRQLRAFGPQHTSAPVRLALDDVITRAASLFRRILPANIRFEVSNEHRASICADEGQVLGVVANLVLNARDAMPDGGRLTVCLREASADEVTAAGLSGAFAALDVADDGTGMSRETLARVFEPFFTTKGGGGTGLGLASVRDVVTESGGAVRAASEPGHGATFTVLWPVAPVVDAESPTHLAAPSPPVHASYAVLVVDDDDGARRALSRALAYKGYKVMDAANGADGLLIARRYHEPLHVLCTDCMMPGIPVRQLVEGVRAAHPETRVILCSGYAPGDTAPELLDAFLAKPFSHEDLASVVEKLVAPATAT